MTITLKPETEARLRERTAQEGTDMNAVVDALVVAGLEWEEQAVVNLRRAIAESDAGKVRLFSEVAGEWRAKYKLPIHLSDEELFVVEVTAS